MQDCEIFEVGQRVTVTGPGHYRGKHIGRSGEVYAVYDSSVSVLLDGIINKNSGYGVFYFKRTELTHEETTEKNMEDKKMQKMTNFVNVAEVQFLDEKVPFRTYEYANYDPDIKVGDLCVVASAHHGMGLAEVVELKATPREDLYREIVCKVDTAAFDARVETRAKAAELKEKMQERAKQLQDIVLFQTLAKEDPEMQAMLEAFKALQTI